MMKQVLCSVRIMLLALVAMSFAACEGNDELEYWLPGTWEGSVGRYGDASFIFNENHLGSMRLDGEGYTFDWYFETEEFYHAREGVIILDFGRGDRACIAGSYTDGDTFSGYYYEYYDDYLDGYNGIQLRLYRRGY